MPFDMQNFLEHMRGQTVNVNGHRYQIGQDGIARGVADADAAKLAVNRQAWRYLGQAEPIPAPAPVRPITEKIQRFVPPPPDPPAVREMDQQEWNEQQARLAEREARVEDLPPPAVPGKAPEVAVPETVPEPVVQKVVPEPVQKSEGVDEDEWPDPSESMDIDYLRKMADAYGVHYTGKTGKARLVRDIMAAMYPEE